MKEYVLFCGKSIYSCVQGNTEVKMVLTMLK